MQCANCGSPQGPFYPVDFGGPRVCKNTKNAPERILQCVERRAAIHAKQRQGAGIINRD